MHSRSRFGRSKQQSIAPATCDIRSACQLSIAYSVGWDVKRRPNELVLGRRDAHESILNHVPSSTLRLRPHHEPPAADENFVPASASEHHQDERFTCGGGGRRRYRDSKVWRHKNTGGCVYTTLWYKSSLCYVSTSTINHTSYLVYRKGSWYA